MSKLFNKNKNKFIYETERIKNNSQGKNVYKTNQEKVSNLYKDYIFSSPYKNIVKNKKNSNINISQNNNKISNNHILPNNNNNYNTKKNNSIKKLNYNKSFELNLNTNLITENNFDFKNDNLYNINKKNSKNFNNKSVILNNKPKKIKNKFNNRSVAKTTNSHYKTNIKTKINENMVINKLDEKFKSLESNIIDKKYENDIDHDEIIIATNKTHNKNEYKNQLSYDSNKLTNIIDSNIKDRDVSYTDEESFLKFFQNKNHIEFDENYLLNTSFEENRSDFNIMYGSNYGQTVIDDLISLEIKLIVEKMLELQKSYHKELNIIIKEYNKNKKIFNLLLEKIKVYQKKRHNLQKIIEKIDIENNVYNFIGVYHNNTKHDINKINKNEIKLLKYTVFSKDKKNIVYDKDKIRNIFKILVFDKYYKISTKMNSLENKIVLGLMKKFKYDMKKSNDININNNNNSNSSHFNDKTKTYFNNNKIQSNKINSASSIQKNKNSVSKIKNDKKKRKFLSSCSQPKQLKFFNFKNLK